VHVYRQATVLLNTAHGSVLYSWWRGIALTRCVWSTKSLYSRPYLDGSVGR